MSEDYEDDFESDPSILTSPSSGTRRSSNGPSIAVPPSSLTASFHQSPQSSLRTPSNESNAFTPRSRHVRYADEDAVPSPRFSNIDDSEQAHSNAQFTRPRFVRNDTASTFTPDADSPTSNLSDDDFFEDDFPADASSANPNDRSQRRRRYGVHEEPQNHHHHLQQQQHQQQQQQHEQYARNGPGPSSSKSPYSEHSAASSRQDHENPHDVHGSQAPAPSGSPSALFLDEDDVISPPEHARHGYEEAEQSRQHGHTTFQDPALQSHDDPHHAQHQQYVEQQSVVEQHGDRPDDEAAEGRYPVIREDPYFSSSTMHRSFVAALDGLRIERREDLQRYIKECAQSWMARSSYEQRVKQYNQLVNREVDRRKKEDHLLDWVKSQRSFWTPHPMASSPSSYFGEVGDEMWIGMRSSSDYLLGICEIDEEERLYEWRDLLHPHSPTNGSHSSTTTAPNAQYAATSSGNSTARSGSKGSAVRRQKNRGSSAPLHSRASSSRPQPPSSASIRKSGSRRTYTGQDAASGEADDRVEIGGPNPSRSSSKPLSTEDKQANWIVKHTVRDASLTALQSPWSPVMNPPPSPAHARSMMSTSTSSYSGRRLSSAGPVVPPRASASGPAVDPSRAERVPRTYRPLPSSRVAQPPLSKEVLKELQNMVDKHLQDARNRKTKLMRVTQRALSPDCHQYLIWIERFRDAFDREARKGLTSLSVSRSSLSTETLDPLSLDSYLIGAASQGSMATDSNHAFISHRPQNSGSLASSADRVRRMDSNIRVLK
eukprot:ANDGO_06770.mRNA.1 hypothetical protein